MPHLSDRILSDKWGVVHSGAHLFFCFIFNPLIRGSRPHSFEDGTTLAIDCITIEDEYGNTPAQRAFWVFVRFKGIHSACSYRLTHGPAPQQADAEPVPCFIAGQCRYPLRTLCIKYAYSAFPSSLLLYPSPHVHMASRTGFRLYPSSVSVYSTRGGTSA